MVDFVSLSIKPELLQALCSAGLPVHSLIECRTKNKRFFPSIANTDWSFDLTLTSIIFLVFTLSLISRHSLAVTDAYWIRQGASSALFLPYSSALFMSFLQSKQWRKRSLNILRLRKTKYILNGIYSIQRKFLKPFYLYVLQVVQQTSNTKVRSGLMIFIPTMLRTHCSKNMPLHKRHIKATYVWHMIIIQKVVINMSNESYLWLKIFVIPMILKCFSEDSENFFFSDWKYFSSSRFAFQKNVHNLNSDFKQLNIPVYCI